MDLKESFRRAKTKATQQVAENNYKRLCYLVLNHGALVALKKPVPDELVSDIELFYNKVYDE